MPTHPWGGWGNTGDLTNHGIKCPTTGAKSAVKSPPPSRGFDNTSKLTISAYFIHATSSKPVASKIIVSAILMQLHAENWSVIINWTTVNFPRGGDKKQCQIPTWGVGHEIDKCVNLPLM